MSKKFLLVFIMGVSLLTGGAGKAMNDDQSVVFPSRGLRERLYALEGQLEGQHLTRFRKEDLLVELRHMAVEIEETMERVYADQNYISSQMEEVIALERLNNRIQDILNHPERYLYQFRDYLHAPITLHECDMVQREASYARLRELIASLRLSGSPRDIHDINNW